MDIVKQNDAPAAMVESIHDTLNYLARRVCAPVEGVHVDSEHRDIAALQISHSRRAFTQVGEAEERRDGSSNGLFHSGEPGVDFLFCSIIRLSRQVLVGPGVAANRMPLAHNLLEDCGRFGSHLAHAEEGGLGALCRQRG